MLTSQHILLYFHEENDLATLMCLINGFNTIVAGIAYTNSLTVDLKDGQLLAVDIVKN